MSKYIAVRYIDLRNRGVVNLMSVTKGMRGLYIRTVKDGSDKFKILKVKRTL